MTRGGSSAAFCARQEKYSERIYLPYLLKMKGLKI